MTAQQSINRDLAWSQPGALYGYCPKCGQPGEMRERIDGAGKDRCQRKHVYLSTSALDKAKLITMAAENKG